MVGADHDRPGRLRGPLPDVVARPRRRGHADDRRHRHVWGGPAAVAAYFVEQEAKEDLASRLDQIMERLDRIETGLRPGEDRHALEHQGDDCSPGASTSPWPPVMAHDRAAALAGAVRDSIYI